jgi:hypothetical protein
MIAWAEKEYSRGGELERSIEGLSGRELDQVRSRSTWAEMLLFHGNHIEQAHRRPSWTWCSPKVKQSITSLLPICHCGVLIQKSCPKLRFILPSISTVGLWYNELLNALGRVILSNGNCDAI